MKLIERLLRQWYEFRYRDQDKDVCCCGGYVSKCDPWYCGASGVSSVDYAVFKSVEHRMIQISLMRYKVKKIVDRCFRFLHNGHILTNNTKE